MQTQKCIWSRFSKLCISFQTQKHTWILFEKKSRSINEVLFKYKQSTFWFYFSFYTSFILLFRKSRSINEVLFKYKQSTFWFFFSFYTSFILLFRNFTKSILLLELKDQQYRWSIIKIYSNYTSHIVFSARVVVVSWWFVAICAVLLFVRFCGCYLFQ